MTIKAKFTGSTTDPNYQNGSNYELSVKGKEISKLKDGSGVTVYGSVKAFLTNWTEIQVISHK